MEQQSLLSKITVKIGLAILVISLLDLVYLNFLVIGKDVAQEARTLDLKSKASDVSPSGEADAQGKAFEASGSSSAPTQSTGGQTIVQTAQKEIFIPIGDGSTKSNSYADLLGAQVTLDLSKYSGVQSADFEASIWVTGGNGRAYAQLYNKTAGRPVWNSEISTTSGSGILMVSAPINLDAGQNTYIVQAKTNITEFAANVATSRIKIVLR